MPSENVAATGTGDRRTRKREARRDHLLDLAAELVEERGVDGVTMAALAEVADYAPASLYTYFSSRSALMAALQERALATLREVGEDALAAWDDHVEAAGTDPATAALARLHAFSDLFLSAPDHHPREFRLQQQLLVTRGVEESADAARVVPAAMAVLDLPRRLLASAAAAGALDEARPVVDPLGNPLDGTLGRTFAWIVALNGALLADGLTTGLPAPGSVLGAELTATLLRGWGADPARLTTARDLARTWA